MLEATFRLKDSFVAKYHTVKPPFGFNGLGELVYMRTYSRIKEDGSNEQWWETVRRVVEGTYRMQERHIMANDLGWNDARAQKSAQEMYDRIFNMKFLPPGRGLWAMGSPITEERGMFAALNNCAFVSTDNIDKELEKPFCFLMDASMLGVGVGFDTKGSGRITIQTPGEAEGFTIPDTREGWVVALAKLLRAFFVGEALPVFDYSEVRAAGLPIKGFGGVSSGPEPLRDLLDKLKDILTFNIGQPISVTVIVDIMNLIGKCVVAGNVRRTAEISFGAYNDQEYLDLKNYEVNPHRAEYGWTSNNSIFAEVGMDYSSACERVRYNGEPGFAWLENMQKYSRMNGVVDNKDKRAKGGNPCLEQSLESHELCCLVETFPANHDSLADYVRTLKFAYLYAKTVTLGKTHWPETNKVMLRNRRIGCSMSGVAQFITKHSLETLRQWCEEGYDKIQYYDQKYSEWFATPRSIKTTSIKPSGTVSLLAGATPGMHYPESRCYIRRMRLSIHSDLIAPLRAAGYKIEPAYGSEGSTVVVEIPVKIADNIRTVDEVSMWEQLSLAAFLQRYWADNQVSSTITFKPGLTKKEEEELEGLPVELEALEDPELTQETFDGTQEDWEAACHETRKRLVDLRIKQAAGEGHQIAHALDFFQYQLKGISFLPKLEHGAYQQMPYESISEDNYKAMAAGLKPLDFTKVAAEEAEVERFCNNDTCIVVPKA